MLKSNVNVRELVHKITRTFQSARLTERPNKMVHASNVLLGPEKAEENLLFRSGKHT